MAAFSATSHLALQFLSVLQQQRYNSASTIANWLLLLVFGENLQNVLCEKYNVRFKIPTFISVLQEIDLLNSQHSRTESKKTIIKRRRPNYYDRLTLSFSISLTLDSHLELGLANEFSLSVFLSKFSTYYSSLSLELCPSKATFRRHVSARLNNAFCISTLPPSF